VSAEVRIVTVLISVTFGLTAALIGVYLFQIMDKSRLPNALLPGEDLRLMRQTKRMEMRLRSCLGRFSRRDVPWDEIASSLCFQVKGGASLVNAIKGASEEGNSQGHKMLQRAHQLYETGVPIFRALDMVSSGEGELAMIANVLEIGSVTGGDLSALLRRVSEILRRRRLTQGEIQAKLSESKMTAVLLSCLPWLIGFLTFRADPRSFIALVSGDEGRILFVLCFALWAVGNLFVVVSIRSISLTRPTYRNHSKTKTSQKGGKPSWS